MKDEKEIIGKESQESGDAASSAGEGLLPLPDEEIARLRAGLEAKSKEAEDNYARFLRACADLDNYKKRVEKEKAEMANFACENIVAEILPVVDNLNRALEHSVGGHNNIEALKEGVGLTIDQFFSVLKKFGLEEIKSVGERFDPSVHHAISHVEGEGEGPEVVVSEFQKGYMLKGRLLRPSMVAVARRPVKASMPEEKEGGSVH